MAQECKICKGGTYLNPFDLSCAFDCPVGTYMTGTGAWCRDKEAIFIEICRTCIDDAVVLDVLKWFLILLSAFNQFVRIPLEQFWQALGHGHFTRPFFYLQLDFLMGGFRWCFCPARRCWAQVRSMPCRDVFLHQQHLRIIDRILDCPQQGKHFFWSFGPSSNYC